MSILRLAVTVLALLLPLRPATLTAQQPHAGRVTGVVFDSVGQRPLAGASVMVVQLEPAPQRFHVAITDAEGRFEVDSLLAGRISIGFTTPLLDSLEITVPPVERSIGAGETIRMDLATPSRGRLFAGACPGIAAAPGAGALVGQVHDADTDEPLRGATVVLRWRDLQLDRTTLRATNPPLEVGVPTDSLGVYRACGVPTDVYVLLQVQHEGRAGTVIRTMVRDDASVGLQNLSISAGAARPFGDAAASDTAPPRLTGTAGLEGIVTDNTGRPIADAVVRVASTAGTARTDADGRFALGSLPAGTQLLEVRRIGFILGQHPVELRSNRTVTQHVALVGVVTLDSIRVLGQRGRVSEFERRARQRGGRGTVIRQAQIEKMTLYETSDIFRRVVGFTVTGSGFDAKLRSTRGRVSIEGDCTPNIVINGIQDQEINLVNPQDIVGIEVYRGPAEAPPQYGSACGVVVIWTK